MSRFPGDARTILWTALFWVAVMLAVLPFGKIVIWMGWIGG